MCYRRVNEPFNIDSFLMSNRRRNNNNNNIPTLRIVKTDFDKNRIVRRG